MGVIHMGSITKQPTIGRQMFSPTQVAVVIGVALAYIIFAQIGFRFAIRGNITALWIPSGVALAALMLFKWPPAPLLGIFIGSFYGNITAFYNVDKVAVSLLVSVAIGFGAMGQAFVGNAILKRFAKVPNYPFSQTSDVLIFALLACIASCLINGTIGALSITLGGYAPAEGFWASWITWWLGDALGALVFAPVFLVWRRAPKFNLRNYVELALLSALFAGAGFIAFASGYPLEYAMIPLLVVIVFRFNQHGMTLGVLIVSLISIISTIQGRSSFTRADLNESLLLLMAFVGTVSLTAYVLAAEVSQRRDAQANLEGKVAARTADLTKANVELAEAKQAAEAANLAKSTFLSTMSHELRTPLNSIVGYTEIQLAGMTGELNDEQTDFQNRVLVNANDLLKLINEVLDLAKIEAGRIDLTNAPFDLRNWATEIERQYSVLAKEKNVTLNLVVDETMPAQLVGDAGRLKQMTVNLLSNGIKFTEKGTVDLSIRKQNRDTWLVEVRDSGIGIPPHMIDTIFEEFRQVDSSSTRKHGGTGLGLAIVRKLALQMGGGVRVQSELGKGSTFTLFLPLNEAKPTNQVA
jgi:signal transduction histidine kinase